LRCFNCFVSCVVTLQGITHEQTEFLIFRNFEPVLHSHAGRL
jgi:hypothetical protein